MLATNFFTQSYSQADLFGKGIFLTLLLLSIVSWILLIYKTKSLRRMRKNAHSFKQQMEKVLQDHILSFNSKNLPDSLKKENPSMEIYMLFQEKSLDLLNKNHFFSEEKKESFLSSSDIDLLDAQIQSKISCIVSVLKKHLFILPTVVSLAPFLGLLGTVWGILITFSNLQIYTHGSSNEHILGGLSLALTTTVLGLLIAIPALIAYNYIRSLIEELHSELENFSTEILCLLELQFRKVEVGQ